MSEKGVWTLKKEFSFEAAHLLPYHDGKCARLHGHSWKARVIVTGTKLREDGPKTGMLIDYGHLSSIVDPIVENYLDHQYLNDTLINPTSENLARWFYDQVADTIRREFKGHLISSKLLHHIAVEIDETCTCSARYEELPYVKLEAQTKEDKS